MKPFNTAYTVLKYNTNIVPSAHIEQAQDQMMNDGSWDEKGNFSFPPQGTPDPSQNPHGMRLAINRGPPGDMGQRSHEKINQFRERPQRQYVNPVGPTKLVPTNFSTAEQHRNRPHGPEYGYFTQAEPPFDTSGKRVEGTSDAEHASNRRQWAKLSREELAEHSAQRELQPQVGDIHIPRGEDMSDPAFQKAWKVMLR